MAQHPQQTVSKPHLKVLVKDEKAALSISFWVSHCADLQKGKFACCSISALIDVGSSKHDSTSAEGESANVRKTQERVCTWITAGLLCNDSNST